MTSLIVFQAFLELAHQVYGWHIICLISLSLIATTPCKQPPPVRGHFLNDRFASHDQSNTVLKTFS